MALTDYSIFKNLKEQDLQLRFAATLLCFHIIPMLTVEIQACMFLGLFIVHALYFVLDLDTLCKSISIHWLMPHTRNFREGILDTLFSSIQIILSGFLALALFSQSLLNAGVLSFHIFTLVTQNYTFIVENIYRSGFMFALIFARQTLEAGKFNFIAQKLTSPESGYLCAFSFIFTICLTQHPLLMLATSMPFCMLSAYYCLDILSYSTNNKALSPDGNYFSTMVVGLSHLFSFTAWLMIFKLSLSTGIAALPATTSTQLLRHIPNFLVTPYKAITQNMTIGTSVYGVFAEIIRSRIYKSIKFNPEQTLKSTQVKVNNLKKGNKQDYSPPSAGMTLGR